MQISFTFLVSHGFFVHPNTSGKTYTLLGEGRGAELTTLAAPPRRPDGSAMDTQSDNSLTGDENGESGQTTPSDKLSQDPEVTVGMIPRLVSSLFQMLYLSLIHI